MNTIIILLANILTICFATEIALEDYAAFVSGNKIFSGRLYKELAKTEKGNFLASPFSVQLALALVQAGAKGTTEEEIHLKLNLLNSSSKSTYARITKDQLLRSTEHYNLTTANKIYVKNNFEINESYKNDLVEYFNAAVENIEFSESEKAALTMNQWVEEQTNHKIKNLVSPLVLDSNTALVLINTLYFQAKWSIPFDTYSTYKKDFFKSKDDVTKVDTMQVLDVFNYYECSELNAQFLELPYKSDNKDVSMIIVLPKEIDGLEKLENSVEKIYDERKFTPERVSVALPKFSVETTIKFVDVLKKLGVNNVFSDKADLSGIGGEPGSLYVSEVIQKNFINVTEDGTEAASATAVHGIRKSGSDYIPKVDKRFVADHPFAYYIAVKHLVIFQGRYSSP